MNRTMSVTISISTNPSVAGRYFVDVRDTTAGRNRQVTTRTRDKDEVTEFLAAIEDAARGNSINVTITDTTREVL